MIRMRFLFCLLVLFFVPKIFFAQSDVEQDLIVVHFDASDKTLFKQKIFSYHFSNGSFVGRRELLTVNGKKDEKDYIRTDIGHNMLYKNRYLITGIGNIIDLKDKKVLFDGKANLVRCTNDSAIFYTNSAFKGKFYSVYNFKTNQYGEVKDLLFKPKYGRDVEFDKTSLPFKLTYYPQGKPKVVLLTDAGYGQKGTKERYVPDPPLFWLDNDNFVYTYYNRENTEVSFYKVNVDSKSNTLIGKTALSIEKEVGELTKLNADQLLMRFGEKQIIIDLKLSTVSDLEFCPPIQDFSYECKKKPYGHMVKLNNKDIGKFQFETSRFAAGKNIAAFVKELKIGEESYQQGLMAWNNNTQKWEPVDADEVLSMIGWINE